MRHKSAPCRQACLENHKCSDFVSQLVSIRQCNIVQDIPKITITTDLPYTCSKPVEYMHRLDCTYSCTCPDLSLILWRGDASQLAISFSLILQLRVGSAAKDPATLSHFKTRAHMLRRAVHHTSASECPALFCQAQYDVLHVIPPSSLCMRKAIRAHCSVLFVQGNSMNRVWQFCFVAAPCVCCFFVSRAQLHVSACGVAVRDCWELFGASTNPNTVTPSAWTMRHQLLWTMLTQTLCLLHQCHQWSAMQQWLMPHHSHHRLQALPTLTACQASSRLTAWTKRNQ